MRRKRDPGLLREEGQVIKNKWREGIKGKKGRGKGGGGGGGDGRCQIHEYKIAIILSIYDSLSHFCFSLFIFILVSYIVCLPSLRLFLHFLSSVSFLCSHFMFSIIISFVIFSIFSIFFLSFSILNLYLNLSFIPANILERERERERERVKTKVVNKTKIQSEKV